MIGDMLTVGVVAGVVIERGGKYLLVQEKQLKAYGLWNLPAGRVDKGESIEEAAVRETKEECGYDVRLVRELGVFHEETDRPVKHAFLAEITGGELTFPQNEILDAKWFSKAEMEQMKDQLRGNWILATVENSKSSSPTE